VSKGEIVSGPPRPQSSRCTKLEARTASRQAGSLACPMISRWSMSALDLHACHSGRAATVIGIEPFKREREKVVLREILCLRA